VTFRLSPYQERALEFIQRGRGHGMCSAVAGAGKTKMLELGAKAVNTSNSLYVAFNTDNVAEAKERFKRENIPTFAKTVHGIGYGCVARALGRQQLTVDERKYNKLAREWVLLHQMEWVQDEDAPTQTDAIGELTTLIEMCQLTLTDPRDHDAVDQTAARYGISYYRPLLRGLLDCLRRGERQANQGLVDYNDMLHLVHLWGLRPYTTKWLFGDEGQDWSDAMTDILMKLIDPDGGRAFIVGDRDQAIQGFAFAGTDSYDRVLERTHATELPLSICYRCPTSHIDLARQLVPRIEARPGRRSERSKATTPRRSWAWSSRAT